MTVFDGAASFSKCQSTAPDKVTQPFSTFTWMAPLGIVEFPAKTINRSRRDVLVASFRVVGQLDLDFFDDGLDAPHPTCRFFSAELMWP